MGVYAEMMDRLVLKVRSPDHNIKLRMTGRSDVELRFVEGAYERYGVAELERQLAAVAQLAWTARRRGQLKALEAASGGRPTGEEHPLSLAEEKFYRRRRELPLKGASPSGVVTLGCRGWRCWKAKLVPDVFEKCSEEALLDDFRAAGMAVLRDYREKQAVLLEQFHRERRAELGEVEPVRRE